MSITISWETDEIQPSDEGGDRVVTGIGSIDVDIVQRESLSLEAQVTDHPVEKDSPVSDHVIAMPRQYSIDCVISDRPSSRFSFIELREVKTDNQSVVLGKTKDGSPMGRAVDVIDILDQLRKAGTEISISNLRADVNKWVITGITATRETSTAGAAFFTLNVKEIKKAKLLRVDAPSPREERARRRTSNGRGRTRNGGTQDGQTNQANNRSDLVAIGLAAREHREGDSSAVAVAERFLTRSNPSGNR